MKYFTLAFGLVFSFGLFANTTLNCQIKKIDTISGEYEKFLSLTLNCKERTGFSLDPHAAVVRAPASEEARLQLLLNSQAFTPLLVTGTFSGALLKLGERVVGSVTPEADSVAARRRLLLIHSPEYEQNELYHSVAGLLARGRVTGNSLQYVSEDGKTSFEVKFLPAHFLRSERVGPKVSVKVDFIAKNPKERFITLSKKESSRFLSVMKLESELSIFSEVNDRNDDSETITVRVDQGIVKIISSSF
jgi:hypothetical protein